MSPLTLGSAVRAVDRLDRLRDGLIKTRFAEPGDIRRFIDFYVTDHPDRARSRSPGRDEELAAEIRSQLGLTATGAPVSVDVIPAHVRDLLAGRAQATSSSSRWSVHRSEGNVVSSTGQLTHAVEDVFIDGAGIDFVFRRTYRSGGFHHGPLGVNWDHHYDLRLRELDGGTRLVRLTGELREAQYVRHELYGAGPDFAWFVPDAGEHSVVATVDNAVHLGVVVPAACAGCRYVLRTSHGTAYFYEDDPGFPSRFRVRRIQDRWGNSLDFSYKAGPSGTGEVLSRVAVNHPDRVVRFESYDSEGRLLRMRDHTGRTWCYEYDDFGDLVTATIPATDRYPNGLAERYEYTTPWQVPALQHRLLRVHDTAGRTVLDVQYGTDPGVLSYGRVVRQRRGTALRTYEYEDLTLAAGLPAGEPTREEDAPAHQTTEVDPAGHVVHLVFNRVGNLIAREEDVWDRALRRRLVTRHRYNRDGAMVGTVSPAGRITQELWGRDVFMRTVGDVAETDLYRLPQLTWRARLAFGNKLAEVDRARLAAPMSPALFDPTFDLWAPTDAADVVAKYVYDDTYQDLVAISHPDHTRSPLPDHPGDQRQRYHDTLTRFEHDPVAPGRPLRRIVYPAVTRDGQPELGPSEEVFLQYDSHGRLTRHRDRAGTLLQLQYHTGGAGADAVKEGYLWRRTVDPADPATNPGGLTLTTTLERDVGGAIVEVTTPSGLRTELRRDQLGRIVEVARFLTSAVEFRSRYQYCRNLLVDQIDHDVRDKAGQPVGAGTEVERFAYDEDDNVVRHSVGGPNLDQHLVTRHRFTEGELRTATIDPAGNRTRIDYDARRLVRRITRGVGSDVETRDDVRHDDDGLLVEHRDGRGLRASFRRDAFGRVVETVEEDAEGQPQRIVRHDHDKSGNVLIERVYAPDGAMFRLLAHVEHRYDEQDRRIETRTRRFETSPRHAAVDVAAAGELVADADAVRTCYYYDAAGRVVRVEQRGRRRDAAGQLAPQETVLTTRYEYNALGWLTAEVDPLGHRTEIDWNAHGLPVRVDVRERVDPGHSPTGEEVFTTWYGYDALDRMVQITDSLGNRTRHEFDSRERLLRTVDPLGNVTRYGYDEFGRLVEERWKTTATGVGGGPARPDVVTRYERDRAGNVAAVVDALGHRTERVHDALGRLRAIHYPDGGTITVEHDGNGNVVRRRDALGRVCRTTFDALDQPVRTDIDTSALPAGSPAAGPTFEEYAYDALGRLMRARNDWADLRFEVDSLGRPYRETLNHAGVAAQFTVVRRFDDFGFRAGVDYPSGRSLRVDADLLNRMEAVHEVAPGLSYPGRPGPARNRLLVALDHRGLRVGTVDHGNGSAVRHAYDGAGRLIGLDHRGPGDTPLLRLQSLPDAAGNRRLTVEVDAAGIAAQRYWYDSLDRLIDARDLAAPTPVDAAVLGPGSSPPPHPTAGQTVIDGLLGPPGPPAGPPGVEYDAHGNFLRTRAPTHEPATFVANAADQYTASDSKTFHYDADGNLVAERDGAFERWFAYDHDHRLTDVRTKGAAARFRYDPLGRRTWSEIDGVETWYVHDGGNVIEEWRRHHPQAPPTVHASYVCGVDLDERYHLAVGGEDWWYHTDIIGSTRMLTDGTGAAGLQYAFTPFGLHRAPVPAGDPNPYRFAGRHYDAVAECYDVRTRHFSPALGRFLQRDPRFDGQMSADGYIMLNVADEGAGAVGGGPQSGIPAPDFDPEFDVVGELAVANLYAYARNNPMRYSDPTGLAPETPMPSRLARIWNWMKRQHRMLALIDALSQAISPTATPRKEPPHQVVSREVRLKPRMPAAAGDPPRPPVAQSTRELVQRDAVQRAMRNAAQQVEFDRTLQDRVNEFQRGARRVRVPTRVGPTRGGPGTGGLILVGVQAFDVLRQRYEKWADRGPDSSWAEVRRRKHDFNVRSWYRYFTKQEAPKHWTTLTVRQETAKAVKQIIREGDPSWRIGPICRFEKETGTEVLGAAYCGR